ncbi:MAG TPA: pyridoxal-phosphate dependent enzyme [Acidimicrobiia bacterium]|nr:pyridoxal-phosphate dependent enzyme [Acidimicrobiia bacterium]
MSGPKRMALASLPTPLQRATRLGVRLGIEELFIKRDDLTGFSLGGNKIRKLEFLMGDALAQDADTILVMGGPKSNLCQAAADASRVAGLACELVLYGSRPKRAPANLALAEGSGAISWFTGDDDRSSVDAFAEQRAARLRSDGHRVYGIPRGGATAVGAVGYHLAAVEIAAQLGDAGIDMASIVVGVGSGGTLGGIVSGGASLGISWPLFGASVSRDCDEAESQVDTIAAQCARLLGTAAPAHRVTMVDARGPGYGQNWSAADAASELARESEGLILDPIYTAKAFAALIQLTAAGMEGPLVFWHTGGIATALDALTREDRT